MMYFDDFAHFLEITFWVIIGLLLLWAALQLVVYVLDGIALSRMARNAGHPSPFLAWIPVASDYLLGCLCDRSQYAFTGKRWRFDVILPVLDVLALLGGGSLAGLMTAALGSVGGMEGSLNFLSMGSNLLALASAVVMGFALYQLYRDYAPGREVLYTVLSVFLGGLGRAIILMTLRDRMPLSAAGQSPWGIPQPGGYCPPPPPPGYGPGPWQNGSPGWGASGTTGWEPPPQGPGGTGTTGWNQPPQAPNGPGNAGWNPPPQAPNGPETAGRDQPPDPPEDPGPPS